MSPHCRFSDLGSFRLRIFSTQVGNRTRGQGDESNPLEISMKGCCFKVLHKWMPPLGSIPVLGLEKVPDPGSGSATLAGCSLLRAKGFSCILDISKLQFLIKNIFHFVFFSLSFWSSKPWIRIGSGSRFTWNAGSVSWSGFNKKMNPDPQLSLRLYWSLSLSCLIFFLA